jgi:hypothetical protein
MNDHDGVGVIPGRYAGEPIRIHEGPTPQQIAYAKAKSAADGLAGKIAVAAALSAQASATLLELVGEFDATNAVRFWTEVRSAAHWLSWSCSMTLPTAREHVRVARALRRMPAVAAAFAAGRLSYSKVREVTRVVDVIDEARLCELALTATAAQLAVMISGFRSADGRRWPQQSRRRLQLVERDDGMVDLRVRLPKEEAAAIAAALAAATDQFGTPPPRPVQSTEVSEEPAGPAYTQVDALLDVARGFLAAAPEDRSGEDRTMVVVHVDADLLSEQPEVEDVPAGTSTPERGKICHLQGQGGIEPGTAQRLACDATLLGAITSRDGEVLALGRTRRAVSKAQRRALMIRDRTCQYPGCHQQRHLDAHHRIPWAAGGRTDLNNLVLLCRFHHTAVHERPAPHRVRRPARPARCAPLAIRAAGRHLTSALVDRRRARRPAGGAGPPQRRPARRHRQVRSSRGPPRPTRLGR